MATAYLGPEGMSKLQGLHLHDDGPQEASEVVVLTGGRGGSWGNSLRRFPGRVASRRQRLTLHSMEDLEEEGGEDAVWSSVKIGGP